MGNVLTIRHSADLAAMPHGHMLDGVTSQEPAAGRLSAPLVVEFFGAAGAGKSTLAKAVHQRLRLLGLPARLIANGGGAAGGARAAAAAAGKLASALRALTGNQDASDPCARLMTLLPPGNLLRAMRIRRYAADLGRAWKSSGRPGEVMILDQGYITLVCSMALRMQQIDRSVLARALEMVPRADLLVHVGTPRQIVESRLQDRLRRRGLLERLYGHDIATWMRQAELSSVVDELLTGAGQPPVQVRSMNKSDATMAVETVVEEVRVCRGEANDAARS